MKTKIVTVHYIFFILLVARTSNQNELHEYLQLQGLCPQTKQNCSFYFYWEFVQKYLHFKSFTTHRKWNIWKLLEDCIAHVVVLFVQRVRCPRDRNGPLSDFFQLLSYTSYLFDQNNVLPVKRKCLCKRIQFGSEQKKFRTIKKFGAIQTHFHFHAITWKCSSVDSISCRGSRSSKNQCSCVNLTWVRWRCRIPATALRRRRPAWWCQRPQTQPCEK